MGVCTCVCVSSEVHLSGSFQPLQRELLQFWASVPLSACVCVCGRGYSAVILPSSFLQFIFQTLPAKLTFSVRLRLKFLLTQHNCEPSQLCTPTCADSDPGG